MLIVLYLVIVNVVMPQIGAYANALLEPVMMIVICLAGLVMIFGAVGMKISNNLGATVVGTIFKAIGYICRKVIQAIGWIVKNTFKMIPKVFKGSKKVFEQHKLKALTSNVLAVIVVILYLAIII